MKELSARKKSGKKISGAYKSGIHFFFIGEGRNPWSNFAIAI